MQATNIRIFIILAVHPLYQAFFSLRDTMSMNNSTTVQSQEPSSSKPVDNSHKLMKTGTEISHLSKASSLTIPVTEIFDIEHVAVENDPRTWSPLRKNVTLVLIAAASMISGLACNIQNPAVDQMGTDLRTTSSQFSLSIAMFILLQGLVPLLWCAMSEVKGRKLVYILSLALFTLGSIIVALSRSIGMVIGFRCVQAIGSSAVLSIGAATLADIFHPKERGKKMGIYYMAPLLGPALGPIFGGVLTSVFNWRAIFWFLAIISGLSFVSFILFFHDTFRCERSLTYQNVLKQRRRTAGLTPPSYVSKIKSVGKGCLQANKSDVDIEKTIEKSSGARPENETTPLPLPDIHLTIADVNPFKPIALVLRRKNNFIILLATGLLYSFSFLVAYTSARTLGGFYNYEPHQIGLVSFAFGAGCISGSLLGGRWSDRELTRLQNANGGKSYPEMRLRSTIMGVCLLPPCVIAFGWVCDVHAHVSAICLFLFLCGFFSIWSYSSALAYIVDANQGRSSAAVATNSAFRGIAAFLATELAVDMQDGLGDGWMYTIWGGVMLLSGMLTLLVWWKGGKWREEAEAREAEHEKRLESRASTANCAPEL